MVLGIYDIDEKFVLAVKKDCIRKKKKTKHTSEFDYFLLLEPHSGATGSM